MLTFPFADRYKAGLQPHCGSQQTDYSHRHDVELVGSKMLRILALVLLTLLLPLTDSEYRRIVAKLSPNQA